MMTTLSSKRMANSVWKNKTPDLFYIYSTLKNPSIHNYILDKDETYTFKIKIEIS